MMSLIHSRFKYLASAYQGLNFSCSRHRLSNDIWGNGTCACLAIFVWLQLIRPIHSILLFDASCGDALLPACTYKNPPPQQVLCSTYHVFEVINVMLCNVRLFCLCLLRLTGVWLSFRCERALRVIRPLALPLGIITTRRHRFWTVVRRVTRVRWW